MATTASTCSRVGVGEAIEGLVGDKGTAGGACAMRTGAAVDAGAAATSAAGRTGAVAAGCAATDTGWVATAIGCADMATGCAAAATGAVSGIGIHDPSEARRRGSLMGTSRSPGSKGSTGVDDVARKRGGSGSTSRIQRPDAG